MRAVGTNPWSSENYEILINAFNHKFTLCSFQLFHASINKFLVLPRQKEEKVEKKRNVKEKYVINVTAGKLYIIFIECLLSRFAFSVHFQEILSGKCQSYT